MWVILAALAALAGYLLGSVPTAVLVSRAAGAADPRTVGTRNAGATNVALSHGLGAGAVVFAGDYAKGLVAVVAGSALGGPWVAAGAAVGAILGQVFPVFGSFRGGKGLATTFGGYSALSPGLAAAGVALWAFAAFVLVRRLVAATVVALALLPVLAAALAGPLGTPTAAFGAAAFAIGAWAHRRELTAWRRGELPTWRQSLRDNRGRR